MKIVIARNERQLLPHVAAWDDLSNHAVEPNVFYESWHLLAALRTFGGQFRFVLVYAPPKGNKQSVLCGFFPLERRRRYKGLPFRTLALWKHDYAHICTPLVRAGYEKPCLEALLDWLRDESKAALLAMESVRADGPFHLQWMEVLHERAALGFTDEIYPRALLQPPIQPLAPASGADEYLRGALSRKRRKELKRLENRLGEMGTLTYETLTDKSDAALWIEQFLQLEASGWKGRAGTAFANEESHRRFFHDVAMQAFERNRLMLLALKLNGKPLAMKFNLLSGEGAFACKIAFDEEYARFSPGVLLELDNIRRLHECGDSAHEMNTRWMDSCAIPDHFMINRLWTERRLIQNSVLSTGKFSGDLVVSLLPLLRFARRTLSKVRRQSDITSQNQSSEDE